MSDQKADIKALADLVVSEKGNLDEWEAEVARAQKALNAAIAGKNRSETTLKNARIALDKALDSE